MNHLCLIATLRSIQLKSTVVQLPEHPAVSRKVAGSNPVGTATVGRSVGGKMGRSVDGKMGRRWTEKIGGREDRWTVDGKIGGREDGWTVWSFIFHALSFNSFFTFFPSLSLAPSSILR